MTYAFRMPKFCLLLGGALLTGGLLAGCNTMRPPRDASSLDPEAEVAELKSSWSGGQSGQPDPALRHRAESIAFYNPRNVSSRYLAALMAYQERDPITATHHLDDLLMLDPTNADAAALRGRIALEAGNTPYALRMLEDRIALRPDHSPLREVLASAYYLDGQFDKAAAALGEAERLGAPKDRIAYNKGLIEEGRGHMTQAGDHYRVALTLRPGWSLPRERLKGLGITEAVAIAPPPPTPVKPPAVVPAPPKAAAPAPATAPKVTAAPAPAPKSGATTATAPAAPPAKAPPKPPATK